MGQSRRPAFLSSVALSWDVAGWDQLSLEGLGKRALLQEDPWQQKTRFFALLLRVKAP